MSVSQSASDEHPFKLVVAQPLLDDGDVITTGALNADDGPGESMQLAGIVASRAIIEQAVGMLMLAYELDADNAMELLKWGSQARSITVPLLAKQLAEDLGGRTRNRQGSARCEQVDLQTACDSMLFTARQEVISPVPPRP